jgi:hypothetical protein
MSKSEVFQGQTHEKNTPQTRKYGQKASEESLGISTEALLDKDLDSLYGYQKDRAAARQRAIDAREWEIVSQDDASEPTPDHEDPSSFAYKPEPAIIKKLRAAEAEKKGKKSSIADHWTTAISFAKKTARKVQRGVQNGIQQIVPEDGGNFRERSEDVVWDLQRRLSVFSRPPGNPPSDLNKRKWCRLG